MKTGLFKRFEDLMVAVTFAEKGQCEYAVHLVNSTAKKKYHKLSKRVAGKQKEHRPEMQL